MAAAATQNPSVKGGEMSKSKKKKLAKVAVAGSVSSATPASAQAAPAPAEQADSNNGDGSNESPYLKELHKNVRNINKKITNASKVDSVLAENPDKHLDQLVAEKKINADQKAQILNKPNLQAQLTRLEEQIAQYTKFEQEFKIKLETEKAAFVKGYESQQAAKTEEVIAAVKTEAVAEAEKDQRRALLLISQFLRLAAIRRAVEEADSSLDENLALEGILAKVYGGDEAAVDSMTKIIQGSEESTVSVENLPLATTYAGLKAATLAQPSPATEYQQADPEVTNPDTTDPEITFTPGTTLPVNSGQPLVGTDPTIANAGLTEIDDPTVTALVNGHADSFASQVVPQNGGLGEGGKAAAEANWDPANDLSGSQEWVKIPKEAETVTSKPAVSAAAPSKVQSWADDQPDSPTNSAAPNDGFHEVQRNKGGNRGDGQRGRGDRGGRGRGGHRGDGRGRGRGAPRGNGGGVRGAHRDS